MRNINIINPNQFAYMEGRSTLSELLSWFDDWAKSRNNRKPTDIAFLDFSKAFDRVPHERLLLKLERHSINGSALQWFWNFLNRLDATRRPVWHLLVLVSIFIWSTPGNNPWTRLIHLIRKWHLVRNFINGLAVCRYADDTKVYREISDIARDTSILQSDLFHLRNWSEVWQLNFKAKKCEIMRVTHNRDKSVPHYSLVLHAESLSSVSYVKDLGITILHDISWTFHVVEVVNKANKVLHLIKCTIGSVNKQILSTLYKALVRPILEYASPVWCPYLVKNIVLLEKVQRRASRLALGQRRGEMSYEDRCKMFWWSQLTDRKLYFSRIECYKLVFGLQSLCFSDFFEFASKRTRSNHNYKLQVKSPNCNCYKYSFFVKIIREWNDLPANMLLR